MFDLLVKSSSALMKTIVFLLICRIEQRMNELKPHMKRTSILNVGNLQLVLDFAECAVCPLSFFLSCFSFHIRLPGILTSSSCPHKVIHIPVIELDFFCVNRLI